MVLGHYNISVFPHYYCHYSPLFLFLCPCCPHIVVIVPHRSPLLLLVCPCIIIVMSTLIILWPLRLIYIEMRFCHLYHPRIIHLCNVKEVSPLKRLILNSSIYLLFYFVIWLHNRICNAWEVLDEPPVVTCQSHEWSYLIHILRSCPLHDGPNLLWIYCYAFIGNNMFQVMPYV